LFRFFLKFRLNNANSISHLVSILVFLVHFRSFLLFLRYFHSRFTAFFTLMINLFYLFKLLGSILLIVLFRLVLNLFLIIFNAKLGFRLLNLSKMNFRMFFLLVILLNLTLFLFFFFYVLFYVFCYYLVIEIIYLMN
jgi:hypothetical protein